MWPNLMEHSWNFKQVYLYALLSAMYIKQIIGVLGFCYTLIITIKVDLCIIYLPPLVKPIKTYIIGLER